MGNYELYTALGICLFVYLLREKQKYDLMYPGSQPSSPPRSPPVSLLHPFRDKPGQRQGSVAPPPTKKGLSFPENLSERSNFSSDDTDFGVLDRGQPGETKVGRQLTYGKDGSVVFESRKISRRVPDDREALGYRTVYFTDAHGKPGLHYASNSIMRRMPDGRIVYRTKEGKLTYDRYEGRRN